MGNQNQKQQNKQKSTNQRINVMKCPKCHKIFPHQQSIQEFANHIRNCFQEANNPNNVNNNQNLNNINVSSHQQAFQYEKVPQDYTMTTFKWQKKSIQQLNYQVLNKNQSQVKKLSFQQKQYWFRNKIQKMRIGWQNGADYMRLEKSNILMSSLIQTQKVNMHKEVKIQFLGDKVNDAGGLLRQWIHMVIKQIFDESTGIFAIANTQDIMYKLKWDNDLDEQFSGEIFRLFGLILGKSIFERTPLMCYLDRTILRQICESSVKIQDIYGYDKDTWNYILEDEEVDDLETYFVIHKDTGSTIEQIQLIQDGRNVKVTNQNKFQYVDICIQMMTMDLVKKSIKFIRQGINKVIPNRFLSIFQPFQIEMLLYGVPFIDVKEWKQNTIYKAPYSINHNVIKWFWEVMEQFDQQQLSNMLHFCTGSSRTPIHGFKKLQSNRGNYSKFLIESSKFLKQNPYPKGHTCFNRLELPLYQNYEALKLYVVAISKNNLDGVFGLD